MSDIVDWCREAARYFRKRPTGGEDSAHWANVANAESAERAADEIERLREALAAANIELQKRTADANCFREMAESAERTAYFQQDRSDDLERQLLQCLRAWQPIETAPKNPEGKFYGPMILVFYEADELPWPAYWGPGGPDNEGTWHVAEKCDGNTEMDGKLIKYWMPIPPRPEPVS